MTAKKRSTPTPKTVLRKYPRSVYTQWSQAVCFNAAKLFTAFITSRSITALLDKTLLF